MKKPKTLLLLLGLLVVLVIALFALKKAPEKEPEEEPAPSTSTSLISFNKEDLEKINVTTAENTIEFKIQEIIKEKKEDEKEAPPPEYKWIIDNPNNVTLDDSSINSSANSLISISSTRTIESPDLEEFGLNAPKTIVEYTTKDGSTTTISIGNTTVDGSSAYAIKDGDTSTAYLISGYTFKDFKVNFSDYRVKTLDTLDATTITGFEISGKDLQTFKLETLQATDDMPMGGYKLTSPVNNPIDVDSNHYEKFVGLLPTFVVEKFVEDNAKDLSIYGLDNPSLSLSIKCSIPDAEGKTTDKTYEYIYGNQTDDGLIYFMKKGEPHVYALSNAFYGPLVESLDVFKFAQKLIYLPHINTVDTVDVAIAGKTYTLGIEREEIPIEKTEEETTSTASPDPDAPTTEIKETFFLDGKEIKEDDFRDLYQYVIGVVADTPLKDKTLDDLKDPVVSFTYHFTNGTSKTVHYYPYDSQFYMTKFAESVVVGCNIKQFNFLAQNLEKISAGN